MERVWGGGLGFCSLQTLSSALQGLVACCGPVSLQPRPLPSGKPTFPRNCGFQFWPPQLRLSSHPRLLPHPLCRCSDFPLSSHFQAFAGLSPPPGMPPKVTASGREDVQGPLTEGAEGAVLGADPLAAGPTNQARGSAPRRAPPMPCFLLKNLVAMPLEQELGVPLQGWGERRETAKAWAPSLPVPLPRAPGLPLGHSVLLVSYWSPLLFLDLPCTD